MQIYGATLGTESDAFRSMFHPENFSDMLEENVKSVKFYNTLCLKHCLWDIVAGYTSLEKALCQCKEITFATQINLSICV